MGDTDETDSQTLSYQVTVYRCNSTNGNGEPVLVDGAVAVAANRH